MNRLEIAENILLVWACIAPHGGELIAELAGDSLPRMATTRKSMETLGERCRAANPDTIVVMTPHGEDVEGMISMMVCPHALAYLDGENGVRVSSVFDVDMDVLEQIATQATTLNVPIAFTGFDEDSRPQPLFVMDWGAYVPLWFMGANWNQKPKIVVLCISRSTDRQRILDFGTAIANAATQSEKRIAVICSADQGHGHDADGPYGLSQGSEPYDTAYCDAVRDNDLGRMVNWDDGFIELAFTDSYCQTLAMHGISQTSPLTPELLSYETPTYFGLACAEFRP